MFRITYATCIVRNSIDKLADGLINRADITFGLNKKKTSDIIMLS